ncbi:MAG: ABC transporter permease, partial [Candidatus Saccharimonadales bacterium]|nr:ABC transporter permease [Candidatus Saccharimonadales bacterium]
MFAPAPTAVQAQEDTGTIVLTINYDFGNVDEPDQYDEDPYQVWLIDQNEVVVQYTYSKINEPDNPTAKAKFLNVDPGTYRACVPQTPNLSNLEVECTELLTLGANSIITAEISLTAQQTLKLVDVASKNDVNEKPCGGFNVGWIICQGVNSMFDALNTLYLSVFKGLLGLDPLGAGNVRGSAEAALYEIWNSFRVIGNILFFILFLAAVFGQSFSGFQIFSAYQIKTIMPRLVIGVILIQLSWYLSGFIVDVFNVLAAGLRHIVLAPIEGFGDIDFDFAGWGQGIAIFALTGGLVGGYILAGGFLGLLFLVPMILLPAILAVIFGIIIMLLRNAGILILIVMSPIALATWALPNTAGFARFWWESFWKLLIIYPAIVALLSFGELGARVLVAGNQTDVIWNFIAIITVFAPFFMIPYTFRVAQNVLGSVTTGLDGSRKMISQRVFGESWDEGSYAFAARERRHRGRIARQQRLQYRYLINDRRGWDWDRQRMFGGPTRRFFGIPTKAGGEAGVTPFGFTLPFSKGRRNPKVSNRPFGFARNKNKLLGRNYIDKTTGRKESYAQRLGRFAMGRSRARLSVLMNTRPGGMSLDQAMSARTEKAKEDLQNVKVMHGGREYVLAISQTGDPSKTLGDNVGRNPVTGAEFAAAAANEVARHAKDPDVYNARMIDLLKSLDTAEQVEAAINIAHDHKWVQPELLAGVFKGMGFGNQRDDRSIKHRVLNMPKLDGKIVMTKDGKFVEKANWGAIADHKISDFFDEQNHNISVSENAMYHEGNYYGVEEAQTRVKTMVEGYAQGEDRSTIDTYTPQAIEDWTDSIVKAIGGKEVLAQATEQAQQDAIDAARAAGNPDPTVAELKQIAKDTKAKLGAKAMVENLEKVAMWRASMLDEHAHYRITMGDEDDSGIQQEEGTEVQWRERDLAVSLLLAEKRASRPRTSIADIEPDEIDAMIADTARQEKILTDKDTYDFKQYDLNGNQVKNLREWQLAREAEIIRDAQARGTTTGHIK